MVYFRPFRSFLCLLILLAISQSALPAQTAIQSLVLDDVKLREDIIATEQVLDLVNAVVLDSVIEDKKQRHKGFGGWMLQRVLTRYWVSLDSNKRKYVGTCSRQYKIYDGIADEFDMNIFLMPHLPSYIDMAAKAFEVARKKPRGDKAFRYDSPENYPLPEKLKYKDFGYFTVECELTPPNQFREILDANFLPMTAGHQALEEHPNFGQQYPSFGMTGTWCLDCNHNCRPEIHPIEWLWWLDMSADRPGGPHAKSWMLSLMNDASNRFNDWSPSPMQGSIALPFALPVQAESMTINLQHIASDEIENSEPSVLPEGQSIIQPGVVKASIAKPDGGNLTVAISADQGWKGNDFSIDWGELKLDKENQVYTGFVRIHVAIATVFASRVTIDY